MILVVNPVQSLKGRIFLPASKSYSIRAFIIAAGGGVSRIINPSDCDDAKVAMRIARHLGCDIRQIKNGAWKIKARHHRPHVAKINVGESGTVLRFLLPLLSLQQRASLVVGEGTLKARPNRHLLTTLRAMGVKIRGTGSKESVPIRLNGGRMSAGKIEIDGSLSSQFVSALLIACPQLNENTRLIIKGRQMVSADYVTMTLAVLKMAGIKVRKLGQRQFRISGRQTFKGLKNFTVPSDYGLAAFLLAAGVLLKSDLTLNGNWGRNLLQADGRIFQFLRQMGVRLRLTSRAIRIKGPIELKGGKFSLKNCPDLVPIVAVLALFAKGQTLLTDIYHARAKESDRISDLRQELLKVGADVCEKNNALIINPKSIYRSGLVLDPHHDHRLAMAFAVLGLKVGVTVKDIDCVSKSYPGFVRDIKSLGA